MAGAVKFIIGGGATIVVGVMLLDMLPPDMRWRAFAAFPLGFIFIWLGVRRIQRKD